MQSRLLEKSSSQSVDLTVVIPIYNDWDCVFEVLAALDHELVREKVRAEVLLVDDGSHFRPALLSPRYQALHTVDVLCLRRNLGHQRALAIGLSYIEKQSRSEMVLVMDGDGEDSPSAVPALLAKARSRGMKCVVFSERRLRSEGVLFAIFYYLYRALHSVATGSRIRFGNFSVIPRECLSRIVLYPELWNHYAATVCKSRIPFDTVPLDRSKRISGRSSMNFVSLVIHGLSALSVHGEVVMVRALLASTGVFLIALAAVLGAGFTTYAGWLPVPQNWILLLAMGLLTATTLLAFSMLFCFLMLGFRSNAAFVPTRDFIYFAGDVLRFEQTRHESQKAL